jgi:hypothetical protein
LIRAKIKGDDKYPIEVMMRIIAEGLPHRALVAADFDEASKTVPYFPFGKPLP